MTTANFDTTATALDTYLDSAVAELVLYNAKAHDYRVSLFQTSSTLFRMHIFDEQIGRRVAYFELENPDYANLPERLLLNSINPLNGGEYSGVQGWLKLKPAALQVSAAVFQYEDPAQSRINRARVTKQTDYTNRHKLDEFQEIVEVGSSRTHKTIREALEFLYGGRLSDQSRSSQLPICRRANPFHRIAIVLDPSTRPYIGVSEHMPDWVYIGGRDRNGTVIEHLPGSNKPIIEGQANSGAFNLTIRNSAPPGDSGSTRYGWHSDLVHTLQGKDVEGDINRTYTLDFQNVRFVAGANAAIQPFGAGIGPQHEVTFLDCEFDCEDRNYLGPLVSANNSSSSFGGGLLNFKNCRDVSGRARPAKTIAVQTKTNTEKPHIVRVDDCTGFRDIYLSPGGEGVFAGKWLLRGNTPMTVFSSIPGDTLGT